MAPPAASRSTAVDRRRHWRARAGALAPALATAGFAAAGPLALLIPKGLWIAGVIIAVARGLPLLAGETGAGRRLWADLRRLWLLWPLAAFATASALWAVVPEHSFGRGLRLLLEFGLGALVIGLAVTAGGRQARSHLRGLAGGLVAAAAVATADILLDGALLGWGHGNPVAAYAYGSGAAFAAVVLVPLAIMLWRHGDRLWTAAAAIAAVAFVLIAANETAKLSLAIALLGMLAALGRWTRPLPALAFAVSLLAIPLAMPQPMDGPVGCWLMEQKLSIVHRLGIWNFVDAAIAERPVLGWGLEGSRRIPGGKMQLAMPDCGPELGPAVLGPRIGERLPLHPHDFALNIWLELGAVGAFLALWALLDWARRLGRLPRAAAWAPCAAMAGVFLPALASFGMWQGWWLTTLFLLAAICMLRPAPKA